MHKGKRLNNKLFIIFSRMPLLPTPIVDVGRVAYSGRVLPHYASIFSFFAGAGVGAGLGYLVRSLAYRYYR